MAKSPKIALQIADDDPDVIRVMLGLRKAAYTLPDIISEGVRGRTKLHEDIEAGLLSTFVSGSRRCAYAIDFAKYLVALKRLSEAKGERHHLSRPENRPAHDPKRQRAA